MMKFKGKYNTKTGLSNRWQAALYWNRKSEPIPLVPPEPSEEPIFSGTIPNFTTLVGESFSYDSSVHFSSGGIVSNYTLQNAPSWMSINGLGIISGTPDTEAITSNITVTGTNDTDSAVSNPFSTTVEAAIQAPIFTGTIPDFEYLINSLITEYDTSVYFSTGGTPTSYILNNAPDGISIDNSGIISGTPIVSGMDCNVTVTGANSGGSAESNVFSLNTLADQSLNFDGTVYGELSEPVTYLAGTEYKVTVDQFKIDALPASDIYLIGEEGITDNYVKINSAGNLIIEIGGQLYSNGTISLGEYYKFEAHNTAGGMEYKLNSEVVSSQAAATTDFNGKYIGCHSAGSNGFIGTIGAVKLESQGTEQEWKFDEGGPVYETGAEQVVNGTFDNGLDSWTPGDCIQEVINGQLVLTSDGGPNPRSTQSVSATPSIPYIISFNAIAADNSISLVVFDSGWSKLFELIGVGYHEIISVSDTNMFHMQLKCRNGTIGQTATFDNISIKPYEGTISDGNLVIPEQSQGWQPDIMRGDEWSTVAGATTSGRTVTWDGTQANNSVITANSGDTSSVLNYITNINSVSQGTVKAEIGNVPVVIPASSGFYANVQNADSDTIDVVTNTDSVTGDCTINEISPVQQGVIMYNVEDADWTENNPPVSYFLNPDSEMLAKIQSRAESTYNVTIDSKNYLAAVNCPWGTDNNLNTVLMTDGNGGGAGSATLAQKLDALSEFITQLEGNDDDETSITVGTMEDFLAAVPYLESGIIDTIISESSI